MPGELVFLILLTEPDAETATSMLRAALPPALRLDAIQEAPVRGIDFFAARGAEARRLDAWWAAHIAPDARPVILVMHEPGLDRLLSGLDSEVVVGVARDEERRCYAGFRHVGTVVAGDALALARHVIDEYEIFEPAEDAQPSVLFMPRLPVAGEEVTEQPQPDRPWPGVVSDPFTELASVGPLIDEPEELAVQLSRASLFSRRPDRSDRSDRLELRGRTGRSDHGGRPPPGGSSGGGSALNFFAWLFGRRRAIVIPREIGDLVLGLNPAPLVVVPARKGGVGKTVTAGAIAQVIGYALGETTGTVAIVDQNIGNPDQWGRMDVPTTAGTVRQMMAALSSGLELPPTPAWAKTPALAVYPEDRTSVDAYPPGLIQRFVHQLRQRHVFMVVDLPNRLPDYTSAEAAICAAYLDLADLVVLPTTDDPSALLGVMEYLDSPSMRGKPVIVSYIVSTDRQVRRHPVVTDLLEDIRKRVVAIEMVPKSEKATLAIVKGMSILDISPRLRDAYIRVTQATVRALAASSAPTG